MSDSTHTACGSGCDCGGSCQNHDHQHAMTITFEDGTEHECPVIDFFDINGQEYIALLHPNTHQALVYRFFEEADESLRLDVIDDEEEFKLVSDTFIALTNKK